MDLASLTPTSDTLEILLVHPMTLEPLFNDDEDTEMSVTVMSPHSAEYKKIFNARANKRLQAMQRSKRQQMTVEDLESDAIELLASIITGWDMMYDGEKPKLTAGKVKEVLATCPWLRSQVEEAVEEARAFIRT